MLDNFTDYEIEKIEIKFFQPFFNALKYTLLIFPFIALLMPYIPRKRGKPRLIDEMEYLDALLYLSIPFFFILIITSIWKFYKLRNQFELTKRFLTKKNIDTQIIKLSKSYFSNYNNIITFKIDCKIVTSKISREQSVKFKSKEIVRIELEETTKTILSINKVEK